MFNKFRIVWECLKRWDLLENSLAASFCAKRNLLKRHLDGAEISTQLPASSGRQRREQGSRGITQLQILRPRIGVEEEQRPTQRAEDGRVRAQRGKGQSSNDAAGDEEQELTPGEQRHTPEVADAARRRRLWHISA